MEKYLLFVGNIEYINLTSPAKTKVTQTSEI